MCEKQKSKQIIQLSAEQYLTGCMNFNLKKNAEYELSFQN